MVKVLGRKYLYIICIPKQINGIKPVYVLNCNEYNNLRCTKTCNYARKQIRIEKLKMFKEKIFKKIDS
tara:strand:+ start:3529 stop:3732 length:204 start_codon:yes stop_codon:yes gene_type:complete